MAFLRMILNKCQHDGCRADATHEVLTCRSESIGRFCHNHAEDCHARIAREEAAEASVARAASLD